MKILTLEQIKGVLPCIDLMKEIAAGFVAYSTGRAVVPPVGELILDDPPGDVHIKYGYIGGDDYYVIKVASGFYENSRLNLPSSNGLMLVFKQQTGELTAVLLDEGYLTDVRTAIAGAIAAKYLAPKTIERIGIIGTGMQSRLQLEYLAPVTECRDVLVWGRDADRVGAYRMAMAKHGFKTEPANQADSLMNTCNLIVTTTPSDEPLLHWPDKHIGGIHITAMGSDTAVKQELDADILGNADLVVADSIAQCETRGEIHHALTRNSIDRESIVELGNIIAGNHPGRTSDEQITVADLTGVAVQDIQIAQAVFQKS